MPKRVLFLLVLFSLFCAHNSFSQNYDDEIELMSLQQIDTLIEATAYNDALKALAKYIDAYPKDFDRAQSRISKIMGLREDFNKGAESLVELIVNGDESKSGKLSKITELENSELDASDTVIAFTNLARRTVTLGEVLLQYNRVMRDGIRLVKKENYIDAAHKFEEGFVIKNEFSDFVFDSETAAAEDSGTQVVYESDITENVKAAIERIKFLVAGSGGKPGMEERRLSCEKAYNEYIKALSSKNTERVRDALVNVKASFGNYAALRNEIVEQAHVLDLYDDIANERNPLLMGTSYITFQQKFIMGDESHPDTGIVGSLDAYFNRRIESMKERTNEVVFDLLNSTIKSLPENKIYSLSKKIDGEQNNVAKAKDYAEFGKTLHSLYDSEVSLDGKSVSQKHSGYSSSIGFVSEYISDLALAYSSVKELAFVKANPEQIDKKDLSDEVIEKNLEKLWHYEKIKADSKSYINLVVDEQKKEKRYFDAKAEREREIAELVELSGGTLNITAAKKRNTAGVQVSDDPLDFRKQIEYFTSVNNQNLAESSSHAQNLWSYFAQVYSSLAQKDFDSFARRSDEIESMLSGKSEEGEQFVKKYPVEAKEGAERANREIAEKNEELLGLRQMLEGGKEYKGIDADYDEGIERLEAVISKFDTLRVRNLASAKKAEPEIKLYEAKLKEAYEQYEIAKAAFSREDFDGANEAIDAASLKFAEALDIEYSEKIRFMREESLSDLAAAIAEAEYEKVLREVFEMKDLAMTYYYSSNFDSAETILLTAQSKWAKVSMDADPEIEELLNVVKTVKAVSYGRVLLPSDPHYPELSYSIDMAKQSYEKGAALKKESEADKANIAFGVALTNVRNVQNVYPLNKEARLIALKIQQELDPEGFPKQFEHNYNAAKMNSNKNERLADLEDLYEINPKYPGLADEIYSLKESLGLFPKKTVNKETKKASESKFKEAKSLFKKAGNDTSKLNQALALVNEAISIDGSNKSAKKLKLDIQLKIGAGSSAILSQNDEKIYAEAARLFNQRKFSEAKQIMDGLMKNPVAAKSRKVTDLYKRLLKRL